MRHKRRLVAARAPLRRGAPARDRARAPHPHEPDLGAYDEIDASRMSLDPGEPPDAPAANATDGEGSRTTSTSQPSSRKLRWLTLAGMTHAREQIGDRARE
jgi:hypothetical protein